MAGNTPYPLNPHQGERFWTLDALRGIAVLLVMIRHSWPNLAPGAGIVGVVMFFALSGYLITGVIVNDLNRHGHVRFRRFYVHRVFRLTPPLVALILGIILISAVNNPLDDRKESIRTAVVALTYTANIPFNHGSPAIGHLWTLATEEQFYLFWPLALAIGFSLGKLRGTLWLALLVTAGLALSSSVLLADYYGARYIVPTSWAVTMVMGAVVKYHERPLTDAINKIFGYKIALTCMAGVTLFFMCLFDLRSIVVTPILMSPAIAASTLVLILVLKNIRGRPPLPMRPIWALGLVSYAAYLWNLPTIIYLEAWLGNAWASVLALPLTALLACASWFAIERPSRTLRRHWDQHQKTSFITPAVNSSSPITSLNISNSRRTSHL